MLRIENVGEGVWEPHGIGLFYYWHLVQQKKLVLFGRFTLCKWVSSSHREYDYEKGFARSVEKTAPE